MVSTRARACILSLFLLAPIASAHVLPYAPYTNRAAMPSIHHRASRWFALTVGLPGEQVYGRAEVVLYDALGLVAPRVIYRPDLNETVLFVAVWESQFLPAGSPPSTSSILISTYEFTSPFGKPVYLFSRNSGRTFTQLTELDGAVSNPNLYDADYGGPFTHGMKAGAAVVICDIHRFILGTNEGIFAIDNEGKVTLLHPTATIIGHDRSGEHLLVNVDGLFRILDARDTRGILKPIDKDTVPRQPSIGWITGDDSVYLETIENGFRYFYLYRNLSRIQIAGPIAPDGDLTFFAVPTSDYNGAWMMERGSGKPATLSRHTIAAGTETMWSDASGPEVEALHTAARSPDKLLIQARHSSLGPALALWRAGEPAPHEYGELLLNEQPSNGFTHLDVDSLADGSSFLFDAGNVPNLVGEPGGLSGGGPNAIHEGIVRASLTQRLVLPGVARQPGAFGSYWLSDLVIHNPLDTPQNVDFRFVSIGSAAATIGKTITLAPREIAVYKDAVKSLFDIDEGGGVIYINPKVAVGATARTYTRAGNGSFGFGMEAIDVFDAASPGSSVTFAGAFQGFGFRTNLLLTDLSGQGAEAELHVFGAAGETTVTAPAGGVQQWNGIGGFGGLEVQPTRGSMIATVVAMDNRTNDPTFFPPDLPASAERVIPVVGHVDGANNAKFRSDLYLLNPTGIERNVTIEAKPWDRDVEPSLVTLTLQGGEARLIPDALTALFGLTGLARLRFITPETAGRDGVHMTSRTYSVNADGGTYGCLVPPLDASQGATADQSLEILGVTGDSSFRTSVGLVDLNSFYDGSKAEAKVRIFDESGAEIDAFDVSFPTAGGIKIDDLFKSGNLTAPKAALIRVEVKSGHIAAFATLTDNITNDATYLAANLAAKAK